LGNAAIAGVERQNSISEQKQAQPTASLLAADNPNSAVDPVAAFLSGPYADTGDYAEALADYNPLTGPLLASSDAASTYAGVYGPVGGDHTRIASDEELAQSQADIDRLQAQGDDTTAAQQALDELRTRTYVGDGSGYSVPAEAPTLANFTVTSDRGNANGYAGLANYMAALPALELSDGINPNLEQLSSVPVESASSNMRDYTDSLVTGFDLAGTAAEVGDVLSEGLGKTWGVSINWANPSGYDQILIDNGGRAPAWLANPKFSTNIGSDAEALRNADYVADFSYLGKAAPWLKILGRRLGLGGVAIEATLGIANNDPAEVGHAAVDYGFLEASTAIGGLGGLAVGIAWLGIDSLAQQYTYKGQSGWGALWHSSWDAQEQMQREDPKFYQRLWSQPKE
jgi:hypothetical protein